MNPGPMLQPGPDLNRALPGETSQEPALLGATLAGQRGSGAEREAGGGTTSSSRIKGDVNSSSLRVNLMQDNQEASALDLGLSLNCVFSPQKGTFLAASTSQAQGQTPLTEQEKICADVAMTSSCGQSGPHNTDIDSSRGLTLGSPSLLHKSKNDHNQPKESCRQSFDFLSTSLKHENEPVVEDSPPKAEASNGVDTEPADVRAKRQRVALGTRASSSLQEDKDPPPPTADASLSVRLGNASLKDADPQVWQLVEQERERQICGLELIASENFVSRAIMEALGSPLCNKYSEGYPGARYYGGQQHIDAIERLCQQRALEAFHLDPELWGVNVQPYSCTSANLAVFSGLLVPPKDRLMGLDLPSGGHMSHGYYTSSGKRVGAASVFFDTLPYKVNPTTGLVDYDKMEEKALEYRPKILVTGASSYVREWDWARCRQIADKCGAVLMCDMAHIAGLVAAKEHASPFDYVDVVTSTTHKTMRGPRGGIIFFRKGPIVKHSATRRSSLGSGTSPNSAPGAGAGAVYELEERINFGLFPTLQGGPHDNHTAALAVALKQVSSPEYHEHMRQVKRNAQTLAAALIQRGCCLVSGGTDNHQMLWDLRPLGFTGQRFEKVCEACCISLNKCSLYGDSSSPPAGVRIGTPALTTRGCKEEHMEVVAELLVRAAHLTQKAVAEYQQQQQLQLQEHLQQQQQQHGDDNRTAPSADATRIKKSASGAELQAPPRRLLLADEAKGCCVNPKLPARLPKLSDWVEQLNRSPEVLELRSAVHRFASTLPMPGFLGESWSS